MPPQTRFTRSGNVHIAYQVVGEGPLDLVYVPGWVSHVELAWEEPALASFLGRLASFSRLILFDKRGTGLSDRVPDAQLPTHEERMDDLRAVMDAAGSERAAAPDYPWAPTPEQRERDYDVVARNWGGWMDLSTLIPSKIGDEAFTRRLATYLPRAASA